MKKLILIIILCLFIQINPTSAMCPSAVCSKPYDLTGNGTRFLYKVTCMNFLSEKIAQSIIKSELKKATKEKFKVQMESFSAKDLADGRFKSLRIYGKDLEIEGVHFTSIDIKTLCDFNYVSLTKGTITFKEPMLMDYSLVITDSDIKKTIASSGYLDELKMVNLNAFGLNLFKFEDVEVKIYNNRFYLIIKASLPFKNYPVTLISSSKLKVENGQIVLYDVKLENNKIQKHLDVTKIVSLLNWINPLKFSIDVLGNKQSRLQLQSIDIIQDKLLIGGYVLLPKNYQKISK